MLGGGPYYDFSIIYPQIPILIIKAPIAQVCSWDFYSVIIKASTSP